MMMRSNYFYGIICIVLLSSCMAPKHRVPRHALAQKFNNQCTISADEPLINWWQESCDPILITLIKTALSYNYDLRIAMESVEFTRARYKLAVAQFYPQINVEAIANKSQLSLALLENKFYAPLNKFSLFEIGLDSFWELDFWGRLWYQKATQKAFFEAQIEQMRGVYITVIADVARIYTDWCAFSQRLVCALEQEEIQKQKTMIITDKFYAGLVSIIDYELQLEQQCNAADLVRTLYEAKAVAYHALLVLLGMQQDTVLALDSDVISLADVPLAVGVPSDILRRRPDIREAERVLAAQNASIGAACAEWFPRFTLFGGIGTAGNGASQWYQKDSLAWTMGPSITWPLINFGRVKAQIKEAEAQKRKAALMYSKVVITALKDVEDALVIYFTAKAQQEIARVRYDAAHRTYILVSDKVESGLAQLINQLDAALNVLAQRQECIIRKHAAAYGVIAIYKALGGGW